MSMVQELRVLCRYHSRIFRLQGPRSARLVINTVSLCRRSSIGGLSESSRGRRLDGDFEKLAVGGES
jgi:hypothetical protein